MPSKLLLAAPCAMVLLAGCNTFDPVTQSPDPGFGEAVKYNAALQTIDPAPAYTDADAQPGESGDRAVAATERYRTGQVTEVERVQTTESQSGGPN